MYALANLFNQIVAMPSVPAQQPQRIGLSLSYPYSGD